MNRTFLRLSLLSLAACQSTSTPATASGSASAKPQPPSPSPLIVARPFDLDVPAHYDASKPAALLLALHGYGSDGNNLSAASFGVTALASAHGIFVAHPNGTRDPEGNRFWDATNACCNFAGPPVDDVAYLSAVIDDVARRYTIDRKRVWVLGLSNGGFMSHRLACEASDKLAGIVSIAGSTWTDANHCAPSSHVSVLEIHGAADPLVRYDGGTSLHSGGPYPSVDVTVTQSAAKDGCTGALASFGAQTGYDGAHPANETEIAKWTGCPAGVDVERWKMNGSAHIPSFTPSAGDAIVAWLEHHSKV